MNRTRSWLRAAAAAVLLTALIGCSSVKSVTSKVGGMFGDDDGPLPPAELVEFEPSLEVEKVWAGRYGKGTDKLYLQLEPAIFGERIFVADHDGRIIAIDRESGDKIWKERLKKQLISGGVGAGDDLVLVGTTDGMVVARDAETGEDKWQTQISSEVLAPPRAADGVVVARSADGKLFAMDAPTGRIRWIYDRTVPALTLRGNSPPTLYRGTVYAGFDSGRVAALDLATGKPLWEVPLAVPSGRSDLERMVDIDAVPVLRDNTIYVVGFHGRVVAADAFDGQLLWTREISSYAGLAVDDELVYVTDDEDNVWALERSSGTSVWKQEGLVRRRLTSPVKLGDNVVVCDFEGWCHWLDAGTGDFVQRVRAGKKPVIAPPLSLGDAVLVESVAGVLTVLRPL